MTLYCFATSALQQNYSLIFDIICLINSAIFLFIIVKLLWKHVNWSTKKIKVTWLKFGHMEKYLSYILIIYLWSYTDKNNRYILEEPIYLVVYKKKRRAQR